MLISVTVDNTAPATSFLLLGVFSVIIFTITVVIIIIIACYYYRRRLTRPTAEDITPLNTMKLETEEESTHSSTVTSL